MANGTKSSLGREKALALLREKGESLGRLPLKSDFEDGDVMLIKAHLGPWPRALEAAGLKEPKPVDRLTLNRQKREAKKHKKKLQALGEMSEEDSFVNKGQGTESVCPDKKKGTES